jgi:hypothetical protein
MKSEAVFGMQMGEPHRGIWLILLTCEAIVSLTVSRSAREA